MGSSAARKSTTRTVEVTGTAITVGDLKDLIKGLEDEGTVVRVSQSKGDQRDPGTTRFTVNIEEG